MEVEEDGVGLISRPTNSRGFRGRAFRQVAAFIKG